MKQKIKFILTCDVESPIADVKGKNFHKNYIVGCRKIMHLAKKYDCPITFMIQPKDFELYPGFGKLCKEIIKKDHDCQLHIHEHKYEGLPRDYGKKWSFLIKDGKRLFKKYLNYHPIAFRAGQLKINSNLLRILKKEGFKIDSSVFPGANPKNTLKDNIGDFSLAPNEPYEISKENINFSGNSGIIEVPLTLEHKYNIFPWFVKLGTDWKFIPSFITKSKEKQILSNYIKRHNQDKIIYITELIHPFQIMDNPKLLDILESLIKKLKLLNAEFIKIKDVKIIKKDKYDIKFHKQPFLWDLFFRISRIGLCITNNLVFNDQNKSYKLGYDAPKEKFGRFADNKNVRKSFAKRCDLVFSLLGDVKNKKVLDLGAGALDYSIEFAKKGADVSAVDLSMNRMKKGLKYSNKKIRCYQSYMEYLTFNNKFDIILLFNSFRYVKDKNKAIQEIKRVSKKGTKIVLIEQNKYGIGNFFASKKESKKWLYPSIFDRLFKRKYFKRYYTFGKVGFNDSIIQFLDQFILTNKIANEYIAIYEVK